MSVCPFCGDSPERPVLRRWEFEVPQPWPRNQGHGASHTLANSGAGRWHYKRMREQWTMWCVARRPALFSSADWRRIVRVTLTRLYGKRQRRLDRDNLVAGGKPVVDALCLSGWLVDDSEEHAIIHYHQERSADGVPAVRFLIEELETSPC